MWAGSSPRCRGEPAGCQVAMPRRAKQQVAVPRRAKQIAMPRRAKKQVAMPRRRWPTVERGDGLFRKQIQVLLHRPTLPHH